MSLDPHGQTHAGNIGLFDDQDGWEQTQRRIKKIEEKRLRREFQRQEKRVRKADKERNQPGFLGRLAQLFGLSKTTESETEEDRSVLIRKVSARPPPPILQPLPLFPVSSIHPEPSSLWLEECGMVRVRSYLPGDGGWTIVPKSAIAWDTLDEKDK